MSIRVDIHLPQHVFHLPLTYHFASSLESLDETFLVQVILVVHVKRLEQLVEVVFCQMDIRYRS